MEKISNRRLLLAILVLLISGFNLKAQKEINVKSVSGIAVIAGRISYEDAKREALNMAKVEALRKAGVSEQLQSYEMLFRSEVNNDFSEFFSSDIQAELRGAVQSYEIIDTRTFTDELSKLPNIEVTINAKVVLYSTGPDPTFNARIEGIKAVYNDGENLTFSIQSTKDCFLHIFGIADSYTSVLYPNSIESFKMIEANKKVTFPLGQVEYPLFKSGKEPEVTRIVFVFTKKPIKYLNYETINHPDFEEWITTSENIFAWIYSLTPDQRKIDYHIITVR